MFATTILCLVFVSLSGCCVERRFIKTLDCSNERLVNVTMGDTDYWWVRMLDLSHNALTRINYTQLTMELPGLVSVDVRANLNLDCGPLRTAKIAVISDCTLGPLSIPKKRTTMQPIRSTEAQLTIHETPLTSTESLLPNTTAPTSTGKAAITYTKAQLTIPETPLTSTESLLPSTTPPTSTSKPSLAYTKAQLTSQETPLTSTEAPKTSNTTPFVTTSTSNVPARKTREDTIPKTLIPLITSAIFFIVLVLCVLFKCFCPRRPTSISETPSQIQLADIPNSETGGQLSSSSSGDEILYIRNEESQV